MPTSITSIICGPSSYPKQMQGYKDCHVGCRATFLLGKSDERLRGSTCSGIKTTSFLVLLKPWYGLLKWIVCIGLLCCVQLLQLCLTLWDLWTVAGQAPLSMGFSRQENWSGLPCPPPVDLPNPGIKPISLATPVFQAGSLTTEPPWKAHSLVYQYTNAWNYQKLSPSALKWFSLHAN